MGAGGRWASDLWESGCFMGWDGRTELQLQLSYLLCDLGQVTSLVWASVSSFINSGAEPAHLGGPGPSSLQAL